MLAVHVNVCTSAHECRNVKNKQYDDEVFLRIKRINFLSMKPSKSPEEHKRDARIKLWSVRTVRLVVVLGCTG